MPLRNVRYRYRELPSGGKQRLAFRGSKVVEVKGIKNRRGYIRRI